MCPPRMPYGKHMGRPIAELPTGFLLWWASQIKLREKWPTTVREILAELRRRFAQGERIEDELLPELSDLA